MDEEFLGLIRSLVRKEIAPLAERVDKEAMFPSSTLRHFREVGLLASAVPQEFGGIGADVNTGCRIVEEIATACASSAEILVTQEAPLYAIATMGTAGQKQEFFGRVVGEGLLMGTALIESDTGLDIRSVQTRAEPEGKSLSITGTKTFVSHGGGATGEYLLLAHVPSMDVVAVIVPSSAEGITYGPRYASMGMRGTVLSDVHFDNVRVSSDRVLGGLEDGVKACIGALNRARVLRAALAVGIGQGAFDVALNYASERRQFGKVLRQFQGVAMMLANSAIALETSRSLVYQAASLLDENSPDASAVGYMAKVAASDMAMQVTLDAIQIMGGYGYTRDSGVERRARDAKATQIWEGTNQILRIEVAKHILSGEERTIERHD